MRTFPKAKLQVVAMDRPAGLIDERIDVAIRVRATLEADAALTMRSLGRSSRILVAAPALAALCAGDDVAALSELPTLATTDQMGEIAWAFSGPDGAQRTIRHEPRMTCVDFLALRDAAVAGLGVALLPDHTCRSELAKGSLAHVFPQWYTEDGIVHLVFTTRRVVAIQHGQAIFTLMVSFHNDEPGLEHQSRMPDVPPPDDLPSEAQIKASVLPSMPEAVQRYYKSERPIELRPVQYDRYLGKKYQDGKFNVWIRATGKLPDDPAIHQCVLAYASDMSLLDTALVPHGRSLFEKEFMGASLDHALWLHRPFRADDWLLFDQDSPITDRSRGFARGAFYTREGRLVASCAQEGMLRYRPRT